jgi:hypothetical protein
MRKTVLRSALVLLSVSAVAIAGVIIPAGASTVIYNAKWPGGLDLSSHFQSCCRSKAVIKVLPTSLDVHGNQKAKLTVRLATNWVDTKAVGDTPNIIQQGLFANAVEYKIQIRRGPRPADHRAQCRIAGTTGSVVANGPNIDVADGAFHTITCVKFADGATRTNVQVTVDGVAGPLVHSRTPIGNMISRAPVNLGGRSTRASSDSLDGRVLSVRYVLS